MNRARVVWGSVFLWMFVSLPRADAQLPTSELMTDKDLRMTIEHWRSAEENYYAMVYDKPVHIMIDPTARDFIVKQYVDRKLAPIFKENPRVSRIVITRDLAAVLVSSLAGAVREKYTSLSAFILSKSAEISILVKQIQEAINMQNCNIIPCSPEKCGPDCSERSYKRFK
jgi:hypothetical protein